MVGQKNMRIWVEVNISKAISRGMKVQLNKKEPIWLAFQYIHNLEICYSCSHFGHSERDCKVEVVERSPKKKQQYGPWLRTTARKQRREMRAFDVVEKRKFDWLDRVTKSKNGEGEDVNNDRALRLQLKGGNSDDSVPKEKLEELIEVMAEQTICTSQEEGWTVQVEDEGTEKGEGEEITGTKDDLTTPREKGQGGKRSWKRMARSAVDKKEEEGGGGVQDQKEEGYWGRDGNGD